MKLKKRRIRNRSLRVTAPGRVSAGTSGGHEHLQRAAGSVPHALRRVQKSLPRANPKIDPIDGPLDTKYNPCALDGERCRTSTGGQRATMTTRTVSPTTEQISVTEPRGRDRLPSSGSHPRRRASAGHAPLPGRAVRAIRRQPDTRSARRCASCKPSISSCSCRTRVPPSVFPGAPSSSTFTTSAPSSRVTRASSHAANVSDKLLASARQRPTTCDRGGDPLRARRRRRDRGRLARPPGSPRQLHDFHDAIACRRPTMNASDELDR